MNQSMYQIDDDIQMAELAAQRRVEGKRLAQKYLDGGKHLMVADQVEMIAQAALGSSNLERLLELQKQVADLKGENIGIRSQLERRIESSIGIDANRYQQECLRTAKGFGKSIGDNKHELCLLALGLSGESGEVADHIKKHVGHGHALDREGVAKELGDTLWYLAMLSYQMGYQLSDVMDMNVEKLRKRYPNGFSQADSIARVDDKPIQIGSAQLKFIQPMYEKMPSFQRVNHPDPEDDYGLKQPVSPCGPACNHSGMADSLVSDLRQGLNVEAVCLGDNMSGPEWDRERAEWSFNVTDIYERTGTFFTGEEYDRAREGELAAEDDFQRHDEPILKPSEIYSIGR